MKVLWPHIARMAAEINVLWGLSHDSGLLGALRPTYIVWTVITWTAMRLGFAKSVVSVLTAVSLTVALMISVFAQSHTVNAGVSTTDDPCADHQVPIQTSLWEETCAALCDTSSLDSFTAVTTERHTSNDLNIIPVAYGPLTAHHSVQTSGVGFVTTHDPPGSRLYLTTQRLRI